MLRKQVEKLNTDKFNGVLLAQKASVCVRGEGQCPRFSEAHAENLVRNLSRTSFFFFSGEQG